MYVYICVYVHTHMFVCIFEPCMYVCCIHVSHDAYLHDTSNFF